ncbi:MAG: peptidylprolyl isomerase [Planctomycetaceae bacterium]
MDRSGVVWRHAREIAAAAVIVVAALAWRYSAGGSAADAKAPPARAGNRAPAGPAAPPVAGTQPVALVNGAEITRDRLAAECVGRHGGAALETLANRRLIEQACRQAGVTVTATEVEAEIDGMARRFKVPRAKTIDLSREERGVTARQYAEEIVWPMIALRRLAHAAIEPTADEIQEAFENKYGPAVKARIIVSRTRADAERVRAQALAAPDDFPALARQHSIDVGSASVNGWVQPIRLHSGEPQFDRAAFALAEGQISDVVQVADQFIVIKCEGHLPGAAGVSLGASSEASEDVRPHLADEIRERKSRQASTDVFRKIQDTAQIENVLNDPAKSAARPGVAALVNGEALPLDEVREACLDRHGPDVLEMLIMRTLIEQALTAAKQTVSRADLDAEMARAAEALGFRGPDGTPDLAALTERMAREARLPARYYVEDVVWSTVALKKLVGNVPVTREDIDRAFAATFGPRARCRVIVLDTQRRAQEVWQLARQNPTSENVGDLAERCSVDPTTKALRGEVPPIRRWGGQPALEREVFGLKPGELSGVVQVADRFMVILCEGFTDPAPVKPDEVRGELIADITEKKQRIEMARAFTQLREGAAIDNFLAGTSQSPAAPRGGPGQRPSDMPAAALTAAEAADLTRPRAGSRQAAAPTSAAAPSGVVPATLEVPASPPAQGNAKTRR